MLELLLGYLVVLAAVIGMVGAFICALLFLLTLDVYYGTPRGQVIQLVVLLVLGLALGFIPYAVLAGGF
jgi:hypothetical protein